MKIIGLINVIGNEFGIWSGEFDSPTEEHAEYELVVKSGDGARLYVLGNIQFDRENKLCIFEVGHAAYFNVLIDAEVS